MKQHNLPEQWERHGVAKARWSATTYLVAGVWSLVSLVATMVTLIYGLVLWEMGVSQRNSADSSGEPNLSLTRAEVIANFFPLWWPLISVTTLCWVVFATTRAFFDASYRETRRFSWCLTLVCALILLGSWLYLALYIWRRNGAPLPR